MNKSKKISKKLPEKLILFKMRMKVRNGWIQRQ